MITIPVGTSSPYAVTIGAGIITELGGFIPADARSQRILIVTDDILAGMHAGKTADSLAEAGFDVSVMVTPHGESSKTLKTYGQIIGRAAKCRIGRDGLFVALGGGVVGDMTGFAAATYMRGIRWAYVPTTLLAMVDASVGGKTAIDIPFGKNIVGAFHRPEFVLTDTNFLSTLPEDEFANGMAEVIKTACLGRRELLPIIEAGVDPSRLSSLIGDCVRYKADLVSKDELDLGCRRRLNFGHTVGHAIERLDGYGIPHGKAVAIGMATELIIGEKSGLHTGNIAEKLEVSLERYGLGTSLPYPWADIIPAMSLDKKNRDGKIVFEIPDDFGIVNETALTEAQLATLDIR